MRNLRLFLAVLATLCVGGSARAHGDLCAEEQVPRVCSVDNGHGSQSCKYLADEGWFWTDCAAADCNPGYVPADGVCVPDGKNTDSSTATETAIQPVGSPPEKGTAAAVNADTTGSAGHDIAGAGASANGGQNSSFNDAQRVMSLGANYSATIGAIYCAEGANQAVANPALSGSDLAACRDQFAAAAGMNQAGRKTGFEPDRRVTETEGARTTLSEFEKNYGITGAEYLRRMLGSGGSREDLAEMLSSKLSAQKLEQAFAAADEIPPSGEKFAVDLGAGTKSKPASHELRQALKAKLESARSPAAASPTRAPEAKSPEYAHLEAFRTEDLFGAAKAKSELSIFDVVRRKYDELSRRYSLVPGRWPTRK